MKDLREPKPAKKDAGKPDKAPADKKKRQAEDKPSITRYEFDIEQEK